MITMRSNLSRAINGCKESVDLFCFFLHRMAEKVNIKTSTNPTVLLNDKGQSAWIRPEFFNSDQIVLNVGKQRGNRFFKACRKPLIKIPPDTVVPHTDCSFSKTNCCCKCQENSMIEALNWSFSFVPEWIQTPSHHDIRLPTERRHATNLQFYRCVLANCFHSREKTGHMALQDHSLPHCTSSIVFPKISESFPHSLQIHPSTICNCSNYLLSETLQPHRWFSTKFGQKKPKQLWKNVAMVPDSTTAHQQHLLPPWTPCPNTTS